MTDPTARLQTALEGRYRVERELGAGGMATVYLAEATVQTTPDFRVLSRTPLFSMNEYEAAAPHANYDVHPDGRRFVMIWQALSSEMILVQNWVQQLRQSAAAPRN